MQGDQSAEPKEEPVKDRRGKKNKKKRGKGKGKKGSRKKKHEEEVIEDGFLRVSTALPEYQSQEPFQPTELPEIKSTQETVIPTEVFDKSLVEMPTHEPDFTPGAPTVILSTVAVPQVAAEVEIYQSTLTLLPIICISNQSLL